MENYSFKTAAFGGFDKQDVVRYLEQTAEKNAAAQREQELENDRLRKQAEELAAQVESLQAQLEEATAQRDQLQTRLETETADRESLRSLERDVARLTAEADALRPDAEAYARFRMRLGDIECEARNRAEDLEEAAASQTRRTAEAFQEQYQRLMDAFTAASGRVTQELQAIQETLTRLPRSMDETESELSELIGCLQGGQAARTDYLAKKPEQPAPEAPEPPEAPLREEGADPFRPSGEDD